MILCFLFPFVLVLCIRPVCTAFHLVSTMFGAIICGRQNEIQREKKKPLAMNGVNMCPEYIERYNERASEREKETYTQKNVTNVKYIRILLQHANFKLLLVSISVQYLSLFLSLSRCGMQTFHLENIKFF